MCECKSKIESELLEKIRKDKPDVEDLSVELKGYGFMFGDDKKLESLPITPIEVSYVHTFKNGKKKKRKEMISLAVSYCPHCGEKVKEEAI